MAKIGEVIEKKYEILAEVGRGGMSTVFLARDRRLNKQWAVKEVRKRGKDTQRNEIATNSAISEANLIKSLSHYHIPHINDIIEKDDNLYVVMEFIEGESLQKIIQTDGPQDEKQVIKWGKQLASALQYLHEQTPPIIYRDMKPSNVMIKPDGDVKLIDFGIAREFKESKIEDTTVLGTANYAPPEQFGGAQTDARSDIYSLGVTLYNAVTGHTPKKGEAFLMKPIREINPALSDGLEKIILKCTSLEPENRYQNCIELIYDLEHYKEIGDAFLNAQKKILRRFIALGGLTIVFLFVGIFGQVAKNNIILSSYNHLIDTAATSGEGANDEVASYAEAIKISPEKREAYDRIIAVYENRGSFTKDDENEFITEMFDNNLEVLREQTFFQDLAFDIGMLYFLYYDYGSSDTTAYVKATLYFDFVLDGNKSYEKYGLAKAYQGIGEFYKTIHRDQKKNDTKDKYKKYWDDIMTLLTELENEKTERNEGTKYSVYLAAFAGINEFAPNLRSEGITKTDMENVCNEAISDAGNDNSYISGDEGEKIKSNVKKQAEFAKTRIETVFREEQK